MILLLLGLIPVLGIELAVLAASRIIRSEQPMARIRRQLEARRGAV